MALPEIELDEAQKKKALGAWNNGDKDLKKIIEAVFGPGLDGRSQEGKAIKKYLATLDINPKKAHEYISKSDQITLTEDQKSLIIDKARHAKPFELAKLAFQNPELTPLSAETLVVKEFYDALDPDLKSPEGGPGRTKYTPPNTEERAIFRIERYTQCKLDQEKLSQRQREYIRNTIDKCKNFRFKSEMENLTDLKEKEFLESQYIKWVWNKPDLTEEDVDLYINLALSMLDTRRMRSELTDLVSRRENQMDDREDSFNQALGESINELRKEISAKEAKMQNLIHSLSGKRDDRLKGAGQFNVNLSSLVELWREKEKRDKLIKLADKRKDKLRQELKELATVEAVKFEMFGLTPEEVL